MALLQPAVAEPLSSSEIPTVDAERIVEIEQRHRRVAELLETLGCTGMILQRPANIAWFTSGSDFSRGGSCESLAALFVTPEARVVLASNVDSPQVFDCQLPALGFQLKERPWTESRQSLIEDLCRGRSIASDIPGPRLQDVSARLAGERLPLGDVEIRRLRDLGRDVAHAVEATARHLVQGRTEAELAGELSHRLMKRCIVPERMQVASDGRNRLYRHWSYSERAVQRYCVISAIGRRHGLCAGAARVVSLGDPPPDLWKDFSRTALIHATAMYFSQIDWPLHEIWSRVQRIYEKFGSADEWQLCEQGDVIGYVASEVPVLPRSEFRLEAGMPIHWHPSIGAAMAGDTILVGADRTERLTGAPEAWPLLQVEVKGTPVNVPDMLRLPAPAGIHAVLSAETVNGDGDSVLNMLSNESVLMAGDRSDSVIE